MARPPAEDRKKGTFADRVLVGFPNAPQDVIEPIVPRASAG